MVDDGSVDDTRKVVKRYCKTDNRFIYIYQKNKGLSGARNTGLRNCKGSYIQLLDADDIISSDKIFSHVQNLEKDNTIDIIYGNVYSFNNTTSEISQSKKLELKTRPVSGRGKVILSSLIEDNMFLVHCALFRRKLVDDVGYFDESMITCEDWQYWFRCAISDKKFMHHNDDQSKVFVRNHGQNMSGIRRNMWIGRKYFHSYVKNLFKAATHSITNKTDEVVRKNLYYLYLTSCRLELAYGNIWKGVMYLFPCIYLSGKIFFSTYDALYWIKERVLNKV